MKFFTITNSYITKVLHALTFYAYALIESSQQPEVGANVTSLFSSDEETATRTGEGMWARGTVGGGWLLGTEPCFDAAR